MSKVALSLVVAAAFGLVSATFAQQPAPPASNLKRTMLQKVDVPGTNYETLTAIAEAGPNVNIGRHTHFGPETGYLVEGEMTMLIDGQPPKSLKAGDSYQVPPGAIHDGRSGDQGARIVAVYVVEKGKPLATPAP